jgi:hypothetical protein
MGSLPFCLIRARWGDIYPLTPLRHQLKIPERLPKIVAQLRQSAPTKHEQHRGQDHHELCNAQSEP